MHEWVEAYLKDLMGPIGCDGAAVMIVPSLL